ncbi:MAG: DNA recombination protein RmuC [Myxococcota bacterium]
MTVVGWVVGAIALVVGFAVAAWMRRRASVLAVLEARQAADAELSALREQLRARDEKVGELSREASRVEGQLEATQERLVMLTGEVGSLRATAERVEELKVTLERRDAEVDTLRQSLAAAHADAARAQSRLEALERERDALDAEAAADRTELEQRRAAQQSLSEENARLAAQLSAAATRAAEQARELDATRARVQALEDEARRLVEKATRLASELEAQQQLARERAAEEEKSRALLRAELEKSTERLLEEKGGVMLSQSQAQLVGLLEPLKERLAAFEQKVEKTYDQDNRDRASLLQHLKGLQEAQARLHEDAQGLARALTGDPRAQGDWGELTLQRVLDMAHLTEGLDYEIQHSARDEEGVQKRPDLVLRLPGDRAVIVDAKVSLSSYVEFTQATTTEARTAAMKAHLASVRKHVRELAGKAYQVLLKQKTLDSVLMFIPSEPAFHAAIAEDPQLYDFGLSQRIFIVSPTTLLPALQLIAQMWRNERQTHHALRIAQDAGRMLDKLGAFLKDLDGIGKALGDAQARYDEAKKKLSTGKGNVLKRAKDLAKLGAQAKPETVAQLQAGDPQEDDAQQALELGLSHGDDDADGPAALWGEGSGEG